MNPALSRNRIRAALLDAHANTRRSLLCWNLACTTPSYPTIFRNKLTEQFAYQRALACPRRPAPRPFRTYDEDRRNHPGA